MDIHGLSEDIKESFSSPNGTPFKLRGCQPDQSRWFFGARLRKFRDVQVSSFHFFILWISIISDLFMGGTVDHQGSVWRQLGPPKDNIGGILSSSDFPRIPKFMKQQLLSVSRDSFRPNSRESMRNRGPVTFQPSVLLIGRSRAWKKRSLLTGGVY